MLIVIIGTRCAGKSTIRDYLALQKGFTILQLELESDTFGESLAVMRPGSEAQLSLGSQVPRTLTVQNRVMMLDYVTRNWQTDFVTTALDGRRPEVLAEFVRRPFCAVMHVDAPIHLRWQRAQDTAHQELQPLPTLEQFIAHHDDLVFGSSFDEDDSSRSRALNSLPGPARALADPWLPASPMPTHVTPRVKLRPSLIASSHMVTLKISNRFASKSSLFEHLDTLGVVRPDRLRPTWDDYFMTLAELAARRSNCMKRRVGAILVRGHHIVATGYNGTARGLTNCKDGGCAACNLRRVPGEEKLNECVCLHAEENALLEAGRDRVDGSILYCNTCPCLRCSVKIVQTGVREVVYNHSYKVDEASAKLFQEAGVILRRHVPPPSVHQ
ncbi:cytidine deaminase-like protein [Auriculariales sp. MPI-PUGE-AT-0066]|nr:cytidine deaminase-like protein [Auriculariales sp. MPI-PUGE-AT-0066]